MLDIEGITLYKILETQDLESFGKLKSTFFSSSYTPIYRDIASFYAKYSRIPSFDDLDAVSKDAIQQNNLAALRQIEGVPDVEIEILVDALINKYAQSFLLTSLDKFLDNITMYDVDEIKDGMAKLTLDLDQNLHTDERILFADNFTLFSSAEEHSTKVVKTGISNDYDSQVGGFYEEELILIGGTRGSGKSLVCANLVAAQYLAGKTAVYYTIEMTGQETFDRIMCIMAEVEYSKLRKHELDREDILKLAKVRAEMFLESEALYQSLERGDIDEREFEAQLVRSKSLKPHNQIVIVDDRELSLPALDISMQKLKLQFGEHLSMSVIDYVNQIVSYKGVVDQYDWKEQTVISKSLKNMARKYQVPVVSPYQIDKAGEARFAKGLLDACDVAFILEADDTNITFKCVKARSSSDEFTYAQPMNWKTLKLDPVTVIAPVEPPPSKEEIPLGWNDV